MRGGNKNNEEAEGIRRATKGLTNTHVLRTPPLPRKPARTLLLLRGDQGGGGRPFFSWWWWGKSTSWGATGVKRFNKERFGPRSSEISFGITVFFKQQLRLGKEKG